MAKQSFDPKKPHPFVADYWTSEDDTEHSTVRTHEVSSVSRAAEAIRSLSRIVHNSLSEPAMSGAQPLDIGTVRAILYGIEVMGEFVFDCTEEMRETASMLHQARKASGGSNE
ncbi:hypothetical protein [Burkholderia gladioli]|uniref:hypothetical protein n=1 Tax=Burkholderia gladioli TaxID=28095 RepID=UPI001FC81F20|nr:hypothetical protein [Burkholderia gladioli]